MTERPETSPELSTSPADRLALLRKQKAQLEARIAAAEARQREADRKARTRRAIVLGEAVLAAAKRGELASYGEGVYSPLHDVRAWILSQPLRPQDRAAWEAAK